MYSPLMRWLKRPQRMSGGYVLVWVPEHPNCFGAGWYYEHRLIYERAIGRVLETWETVHHINQIKTDNRMVNLFLCTEKEHRKAHRR